MKVSSLVRLILILFFVQLALVSYVFYQSYAGRQDTVEVQRKACRERGSVANQANADFQNAHTKYITKVIFKSPSVQEDVKDHAREAVKTFRKTSKTLTDLANIDCEEAYPNASFFP